MKFFGIFKYFYISKKFFLVAYHDVTRAPVAIKFINRQRIKQLDVVGKIKQEIENMEAIAG